jgi:2'-5' RNA ligase
MADGRAFIIIPASDAPVELEEFRRKHIHHPGAVLPFHTTLVAPFMTVEEYEAHGRSRLRRVARRLRPFQYFAGPLCSFPVTAALWLAPSPVSDFERCGEAVYEEFPAVRPSGGFPVYHMTIGLTRSAEELAPVVRSFMAELAGRTPLSLRATELAVYVESAKGYDLHSSLLLGAC